MTTLNHSQTTEFFRIREASREKTQAVMNELLRLRAAGLSVIPAWTNSKTPALKTWTRFQKQIASEAECKTWGYFSGMAIVCGKVSGGLVCIDIDLKRDVKKTIHQEYFDCIRSTPHLDGDESFENILKRVVIQKTQSGGYHVLFRCGLDLRNEKLAQSATSPEAMIETRAEGGYFLCAPTPGYKLIHGDLTKIPFFDDRTAEVFIECARQLDASPPAPPIPKSEPRPPRKPGDKLSPFDDFNERGTIEEILNCLKAGGWKLFSKRGVNYNLTRPGKKKGTSATLFGDSRTFYVHTTSSDLKGGTGYSPSSVMIAVKYSGDMTGVVKELKEMGYGT